MGTQLVESGTVIAGKYRVESLLGQGGMGAVFVVRHVVTHKRLALKLLLGHADDGTGADRFLREARAAGSVQHRHVVDIFDVGHDEVGLYMVMELLEGKPLSELLQDESLSLQELLLVMSRAMRGVAAAHASGVIHRDLKPDNIFVCWGPSGRLDDPRVLDFGISKSQSDPNLTQSGTLVGTPYYMSLEQVNAQRDLDGRVDVYAVGVMLYEAIAGVRPFEADSVSALAVRIATTEPVPLSTLRPDVPRELCDVVAKAMARDRDQRYANMDELISAIEPFISGTADLVIPPDQAVPLRTPRNSTFSSPPATSLGASQAATPPAAQTASPWHLRRWSVAGLLLLTAISAGAFWLVSGRHGRGADGEAANGAQSGPELAEESGEVGGSPEPGVQPDAGAAQPARALVPATADVGEAARADAKVDAEPENAQPKWRARKRRWPRRRKPRKPQKEAAKAADPPPAPQAAAGVGPETSAAPQDAEPPATSPPEQPAKPKVVHGRAGGLELDDF